MEQTVNNSHFSPEFWKSYEASDPGVWTGREVESGLPPQYIYQKVRRIDLREDIEPWKQVIKAEPPLTLIGYACDEGVIRNQGRPGALAGPSHLRAALARLASHIGKREIWDLGDFHCMQGRMEDCQDALACLVNNFWEAGCQPVVLGGGHDVSYGHFKGFQRGLSVALDKSDPRLGILNLDAHFDLRTPEPQAHSGSPFHQILTEFEGHVDYAVLGIQRPSNTQELYEYANRHEVLFYEFGDCDTANWDGIARKLDAWLKGLDGIYLTIDLDGFSSAYAPGVSAPAPMGLAPDFALSVLDWAYDSCLPIALDIAELNPRYDRDGCTARLGARLVEYALRKQAGG